MDLQKVDNVLYDIRSTDYDNTTLDERLVLEEQIKQGISILGELLGHVQYMNLIEFLSPVVGQAEKKLEAYKKSLKKE